MNINLNLAVSKRAKAYKRVFSWAWEELMDFTYPQNPQSDIPCNAHCPLGKNCNETYDRELCAQRVLKFFEEVDDD